MTPWRLTILSIRSNWAGGISFLTYLFPKKRPIVKLINDPTVRPILEYKNPFAVPNKNPPIKPVASPGKGANSTWRICMMIKTTGAPAPKEVTKDLIWSLSVKRSYRKMIFSNKGTRYRYPKKTKPNTTTTVIILWIFLFESFDFFTKVIITVGYWSLVTGH